MSIPIKPTPPFSTLIERQLLSPPLAHLISMLPSTLETATSAEVAVAFMRAIAPKPYEHGGVEKIDLVVSADSEYMGPGTSVRLYVPKDKREGETLPVVIWSHHGGFFSSGPSRLDPFCCTIAAEAGVVVAAPAYRKTPEHPYPAAFDDVYQLLIWLTTSAETSAYSIDCTRIAICGSSCGGTLALGTTLRYRDSGHALTAIRLLILDDASFTNASTSYSTEHNPINKLWNANMTRWMWEMYLPEGVEKLEGREQGWAVPARIGQDGLEGLPSTMVLCAQWDDLTNDGIGFAHRLLEAGVPTEIHTYRGTFHVSDKLVHDDKMARKKRGDIVDGLRAAFGLE